MFRGLAAAALIAGTGAPAWCIDFAESIEEARDGDDQNRPLVIHFGAKWCGWCRKMQAITFADEKVQAFQDQFAWVSIDIDEQKEVPARFQVFGVPHTIVLDESGRLRAARGGFLPPEAFVKFLENALSRRPSDEIDPLESVLQRVREAAEGPELSVAVSDLVQRLAQPVRNGRQPILEALADRGADVWPTLWEQTGDERLAVRAAAAVALNHVTGAGLAFQPFADADTRQQQRERWKEWIDVHRPQPREDSAADVPAEP